MPRTPRLINNGEATVYHVMSRTALDGFPLGDVEKDFLLDLIRRYAKLYLVEILGLCLMGNHFHILSGFLGDQSVDFSPELFKFPQLEEFYIQSSESL